MTLEVQFLTLGLMLASGVLIGLLFDLYRVLAHELRFPRWMIPLLDLLYWFGATLLTFRVLFYSNFGQVRVFVFLGLFAGYTLYFLVLSVRAMKLIRWIIHMIKAFIRFMVRAVQVCIIRPVIALYKGILVILGFLVTVTMFLYKLVVQLLYPVRLLLRLIGRLIGPYWKVPEWLRRPWRAFIRWLKR